MADDGIAPREGPGIKLLPPEEARKIAAGEVIDRPASLIREFMDNAIDAGARLVETSIEEGGISRAEVVDDGGGMAKEDLELCWLAHATSKIRNLDDLQTARTLGFRGEALAAAAAVSRLEALSSKDGREAWKLRVGPGEKGPPVLEQSLRTKGSSVRALGLFDTIPARKRFLKRPGSEAAACRQIFNEKAMAFPEVAFRFTQDGMLKTFLPPASSLRERFAQIFLEEREGSFLHEIAANGSGFSVSIVAGGPELSRTDRRQQFVFANRRRIQDFALLQAFEYGLQGWFPNGTHPLGAVFVEIDPALADFNIHPAKREARFADPGAIHHAISSALREFCRRGNMAASLRGGPEKGGGVSGSGSSPHREFSFGGTSGRQRENADEAAFRRGPFPAGRESAGPLAMEALLSHTPEFAPLPGREKALYENGETRGYSAYSAAEESVPYAGIPAEVSAGTSAGDGISPPREGEARYLGRLFGLFILVEKGDRLFIVDQHAAHERILYDRFIAGPARAQELLVAIPFAAESPEDDRFLQQKRNELAQLGVAIRRNEGQWLIEALPPAWKLSDRETVEELLNLKCAGENMAERWAAGLSCRAAVKDGDFLDEKTALALAEEAFALPIRRCPHGRPIWFEISRDDLLKAVKRR